MMRRFFAFLFACSLSGCSTHPLVDLHDFFKPGKTGPNLVQPYGGVAIPQGPIVPVAPNITIGTPAPFPGGGVIPGPAPLPGNAGPGGFSLQPPMGELPPPFPPTPPNLPR